MKLDQKILRYIESQDKPVEQDRIETEFFWADFITIGESIQELLLAGLIHHDQESGGYISSEKLAD